VSAIVKAWLDGTLIHDVADPMMKTALGPDSDIDSGPDPDVVSDPRPRTHGSRNRTRYYGARIFSLPGYAQGVTPHETTTIVDMLKRGFLLGPTLHELRFLRAGETDAEFLTVVAIGPFEAPMRGVRQIVRWAITLEAPDPRAYSMVEQQVQFAYDAAGAITPGGSISTPPVIDVKGPGIVETIRNETTNELFHLVEENLAASDHLVLDVKARSLTLNGTPRPDLINARDTRWWELQPGVLNTIRIGGTGFTTSTLVTVKWRDARN